MVQRIALLIGGFGAVAVLAVALGFGGFVSADPGATDLTAADAPVAAAPAAVADTSAAQANNGADPGAQAQRPTKVKVVKDTIYIAPTPGQKVVHVNRTNRTNQPQANQANPPQAPAANTGRDDSSAERDDSSAENEPGDAERGHESERSSEHQRSREPGDD